MHEHVCVGGRGWGVCLYGYIYEHLSLEIDEFLNKIKKENKTISQPLVSDILVG